MTDYPHRLEAYFMAPLAKDRFHITWFQREKHWEAHRSLPGINQLGRVLELDGDMLQVFRYMRDIMGGKIKVTRELKVVISD